MTQPTPTLAEQEDALDPSVTPAATGRRARPKRRSVHLTLQSKGGIGKSYVARILCEYLTAAAYDLDPNNETLYRIRGLGASLVCPVDSAVGPAPSDLAKIDATVLDEMIDRIVAGDAQHVVVDTGSWLYALLDDYLERSNIVGILEGVGYEPWLHLVVCGGGQQQETMQDADRLIDRWASEMNVLLWENEHFGPVVAGPERRHAAVDETKIWQDKWQSRVRGRILLGRQGQMYANDVASLLGEGLMFRTVVDHDVQLAKRERIRRVWQAVADQLDAHFAPTRLAGRKPSRGALAQLRGIRERAAELHPDDPDAGAAARKTDGGADDLPESGGRRAAPDDGGPDVVSEPVGADDPVIDDGLAGFDDVDDDYDVVGAEIGDDVDDISDRDPPGDAAAAG